MTMQVAVDHLVVAARTLAEGVAWCEATLGVRASAGGQHVFMGTHNRVIDVSSPRFARSYLEIIAIDPDLPAPPRARWFDLDDPRLQRQLQQHGPQLVHWVARCDDIEAACAAARAAGIDAGDVTDAERMTPTGLLRWRIALRADGRRPLAGAAPTWIQWGERHPTDTLAASGVTLESVCVDARVVDDALLPPGVERVSAPAEPVLSAVLGTPNGRVSLRSPPAED
jgi:hypothetical protein